MRGAPTTPNLIGGEFIRHFRALLTHCAVAACRLVYLLSAFSTIAFAQSTESAQATLNPPNSQLKEIVVTAEPLLHRWKLQGGALLDLAPSMHWPEPVVTAEVDDDRRPVLVTLEYHIAAKDTDAFLQAVRHIVAERRRDGAYHWGIFEDTSVAGRWLETFLVDSWIDHQRQHRRVTNADRLVETEVQRFQSSGAPKVTHYIALETDAARPSKVSPS